ANWRFFVSMTHIRTDDVRIEQGDELLAPMQVMRELPATERSEETTFAGRKAVHDILRGADDHGRMEGLHQRPEPRRDLRHQRGPAPLEEAPPRDQRAGRAVRHRVPRP